MELNYFQDDDVGLGARGISWPREAAPPARHPGAEINAAAVVSKQFEASL